MANNEVGSSMPGGGSSDPPPPPKIPFNERRGLTTKEAVQYTGVCKTTLNKLYGKGLIHRLQSRVRRAIWCRQSLDDHFKRLPQ
jgi:hypothetical protein